MCVTFFFLIFQLWSVPIFIPQHYLDNLKNLKIKKNLKEYWGEEIPN